MSKKKASPEPETKDPVTFISDPFQGLPTLDSEGESETEEVELAPVDETQFTKLSEAMAKEEVNAVKEWEERATQLNHESEKLLEQQVAEDVALQELMEKELLDEKQEATATTDQTLVLDREEAEACIETLLFLSDKPLSLKKLEAHLEPHMTKELLNEALIALQARYQGVCHGFELIEVAGGFQFRTKPGKSFLAKKLSKIQTQRLSHGAMESLAIISYKQPILKEEVDRIRGVDSSHFIRTLLERKLIQMEGRSELPGRPIVYGTTDEFLSLFNIASLKDLPPLQEIEQMVPVSEIGDENNPIVREMKSLISKMKLSNENLNYKPEEDERFLSEMKEKIQSVSITTPYLEEQARLESSTHDTNQQI